MIDLDISTIFAAIYQAYVVRSTISYGTIKNNFSINNNVYSITSISIMKILSDEWPFSSNYPPFLEHLPGQSNDGKVTNTFLNELDQINTMESLPSLYKLNLNLLMMLDLMIMSKRTLTLHSLIQRQGILK